MTNLRRQVDRLLDRVQRHDWIVPFAMVLSAVILAFSMDALDRLVDSRLRPMWWLFSGGQTTARQLLSATAAAMVAIVTMSFSITVTAVTFIAQHYGTLAIRTFMRNLTTQFVMGSFLATLVYSLLVLRLVHSAGNDEAVPRIAVTLGILLALVSFGMLVYFLYHMSENMDAPNLVAAIGWNLERVIHRTTEPLDGEADKEDSPAPQMIGSSIVTADSTGYVRMIDHERLLALARRHGAVIRLEFGVGHFVRQGDNLATIGGPSSIGVPAHAVRKAVPMESKRTLEEDIELGLNQLVQVAIRGLSPGRNDTFATMLCLDRLGAALSLLAERRFPPAVQRDGEGRPRLVTRPVTFADLVDRSFEQIHSFGGETTVIAARMLQTMRTVAVHTRRPADRASLRRHVVAVHEESRKRLSDRIGIEVVEREFQEAMAVLEDGGRSAASRYSPTPVARERSDTSSA
ncbi:MAG: hypothetical protein A4E19_14150 [Nitrospira sp. SG-bin1]|nr:MAG: hypothetical protein A4E19_14150 [Nitrospira sp. SG-bin1]